MGSSTLPSRTPWFALGVLLVGLVAWAVGAFYSLRVNPEIRFWSSVASIETAYADKLTVERGAKTIVIGGSSCAFAIDGERLLEQYKLPVANFGLHAGMGPKVPALFASDSLRTGDTLIVALEPYNLTDSLDATSLATQFSFALGHWDWVTGEELGSRMASPLSALLALRPDGHHLFTLLGKILLRRPLYRYDLEQVEPSGWQRAAVHLPFEGPPEVGARLSEGARGFLGALRAWCDARGIRLAYSLPWAYSPAHARAAFQRKNARFLSQVAEFMPVLRDENLGADSVAEHFADTCWHLAERGALLRTDSFADQLQHWRVWTSEDLEKASGP